MHAKNIFRFSTLIVVLGLLLSALPGFAFVGPVLNSGTAFVVNDPKEITFVDLEKIIEYTKSRLLEDKTVAEEDILEFWEAFRKNGAQNAGNPGNRAKIAFVVPGGNSPATQGIIAVSGDFDKKGVLELIGRHYEEHIQEHMTDAQQAEHGIGRPCPPIGNYPTHLFVLPQRNREVHIVDLGKTVLFASHKKGDTKLLWEVINVLTGKTSIKNVAKRSSHVTFNFEPTADERDQLVKDIEDAYTRYSTGQLDNRRGIARFKGRLRNIIVAKKVKQVEGFVADMENAVLETDRVLYGSTDSENLSLTLNFRTVETAKMVKAGIMKHLVAEVKRPVNKGFQTALENPKVTVEGRSVILRVPLENEQDQMYAFSIMATYAARGFIGTKGSSIVRKLRVFADQEAKMGRTLSVNVSAELSRSSFFSIGRKFSLMFSNMKVKSNVRGCEDVYAGITDKPKDLKSSMEKLVKATTKNFDELDNLLSMKTADYAKKDKKEFQMVREIFQLRTLRLEMASNAKMLVTTLRSPAYQRAAGPLEPKMLENLAVLSTKSGMSYPKPVYRPMASSGVSAPNETSLSIDAAPSQPAEEKVAIPDGMTLEKAYNAYKAALKDYMDASMRNDTVKMMTLYEDFNLKTRIYHAMLEKRELGK